jgi:hypothetical protein
MGRADLGERQLTAPAEQSLILSVLGQVGAEHNGADYCGFFPSSLETLSGLPTPPHARAGVPRKATPICGTL